MSIENPKVDPFETPEEAGDSPPASIGNLQLEYSALPKEELQNHAIAAANALANKRFTDEMAAAQQTKKITETVPVYSRDTKENGRVIRRYFSQLDDAFLSERDITPQARNPLMIQMPQGKALYNATLEQSVQSVLNTGNDATFDTFADMEELATSELKVAQDLALIRAGVCAKRGLGAVKATAGLLLTVLVVLGERVLDKLGFKNRRLLYAFIKAVCRFRRKRGLKGTDFITVNPK